MEQSATRPPLHAATLTNILKPSSQRRAGEPQSQEQKTRSIPSPRSFIGYGHQWLSSSMDLSLNCSDSQHPISIRSRSIISDNKLTSLITRSHTSSLYAVSLCACSVGDMVHCCFVSGASGQLNLLRSMGFLSFAFSALTAYRT